MAPDTSGISSFPAEGHRSSSYPLGATLCPGGANFSVYSRDACAVELLFFERVDDPSSSRLIRLDPKVNRTYHYWHAMVPGVRAGQIYGYRVYGPNEPERGLRYDPEKVLLDPYSKAVVIPDGYTRRRACEPGDNSGTAMKSVVADPAAYDWEGDRPLRRPFASTIIYEMHVRGFTRHPNSGVPEEKRGTYAGLIEKIPYLKDLGVTAVELLPVYQFDAHDAPWGRTNYWGYSPVSFFAPHRGYSSRKEPLGPLREFRDMVKALHQAGIEVILDVVYNHTAEGNHEGPTLSLRGFQNDAYYILERNKACYANYTGCGNTLNASHPILRRMILDSLRYWVEEMHVDGFRFDLASILSRDDEGRPLEDPPVLWDIESDPALAGIKLIAEAWDAGGLYQVGSFIGDSWKEWNGKFRDDVRSFLKGDSGRVVPFACRLIASPDVYGQEEREPEQSINFIACHDGFTLNDLVSYNNKHNEGNGEGNRDGSDDNLSWNCGVEGPTDDPEVERLRNRQIKNFHAVTLLAWGTPMLLMGDEVRRSQHGNNNAYCQDNEISWFDWDLPDRHASLHRFVRLLIAGRLQRELSVESPGLTLNQLLRSGRIEWHGVKLSQPDWSHDSHGIAMTTRSPAGSVAGHVMINAYWEPLEFELPQPPESCFRGWHRWMDTALDPPHDICTLAEAPLVGGGRYRVQPRSIAVLFATLPAAAPDVAEGNPRGSASLPANRVKCAIDKSQKQSVDSTEKNMVTRIHAEKTRITRRNNNRGFG